VYIQINQDFNIIREKESNNDSKYIGKIFDSNNYGKFKVIGIVKLTDNGHKLYLCEFIDTGFKTIRQAGDIIRGRVMDNLKPTIKNKACIGLVENGATHKYYNKWVRMLQRCEDELKPTYNYVNVCDNWLRFDRFLDEISDILGYQECIKYCDYWEIDKDILYYGNKEYNQERCCIIPQKLNKFITNKQINNDYCDIGVSYNLKLSKFRSRIHHNNKIEHLGYFSTIKEASDRYYERKIEILKEYLEEYYWLPEKIKKGLFTFINNQYSIAINTVHSQEELDRVKKLIEEEKKKK
jgi:hypothetical protein